MMQQSRDVRDKVNAYLRQSIITARTANGFEIAEAATFLKLTESEVWAIEQNPVLISPATLQWMMKEYGYLNQFLDVVNITTAIIIQGNSKRRNSSSLSDRGSQIEGGECDG
jgi:transcriptional regulator with XRE-family HTH domain